MDLTRNFLIFYSYYYQLFRYLIIKLHESCEKGKQRAVNIQCRVLNSVNAVPDLHRITGGKAGAVNNTAESNEADCRLK